MLLKKYIIILHCCVLLTKAGFTQLPADTSSVNDASLAMDTSINYDDVFDEFESFLDSLLAPRSYFLVNAAANNSTFNYINTENQLLAATEKLLLSPTIGYYHKSGPGITVTGSMVRPDARGKKGFGFYQYAITPSFDFIKSRRWIAGVSFTRYITKDSVKFYTTPLQNEFSSYFLWRKSWVQPGIAFNYGWGSRKDVEKRREFLDIYRYLRLYRSLLRRNPGLVIPSPPASTVTTTEENIIDYSFTASLRHTFYWLALSRRNDLLKLTPMISFSAGTQKYGLNQTKTTYATNIRALQFNSGSTSLDNELKFQPLAVTIYLRSEYSLGKFFIQPQFILDYYFPAAEKNLRSVVSVNTGFIF